jgi:putative chitinase
MEHPSFLDGPQPYFPPATHCNFAIPQPPPPPPILTITLKQLHAIMRHAPAKFLAPLNAAMRKYQISTPKRAAGFLSQIALESNELRHTHEGWTKREDFQLTGGRDDFTATTQKEYFEYWYGNRADLGNTTAEDGFTFRGRGAIQITGRKNYKRVGEGIGQTLEEKPELVEDDLAVDMLASAYYFAVTAKLLRVADQVVPSKKASVIATNKHLTRGVNGKGMKALEERLRYYKKALKVLVP